MDINFNGSASVSSKASTKFGFQWTKLINNTKVLANQNLNVVKEEELVSWTKFRLNGSGIL